MGTNISMDTRATIVEDASSSPLLLPMLTPPPTIHAPKSFEDNWRTESVPSNNVVTEEGVAAVMDRTSTPTPSGDTSADNTRYGKGKHWKRHMKKKQNTQEAGTGTGTIPIQTERTVEQRREQVRPIIDKLTELQMNISYPAIRELYKQLNHFVKTGEDAKIKISFPEFSRKIKGELSNLHLFSFKTPIYYEVR